MDTIKAWVLGIGVALTVFGAYCMPFPPGPKAMTSLWPYVTATGGLVRYGVTLIVIGLVFILISVFIPKEKF